MEHPSSESKCCLMVTPTVTPLKTNLLFLEIQRRSQCSMLHCSVSTVNDHLKRRKVRQLYNFAFLGFLCLQHTLDVPSLLLPLCSSSDNYFLVPLRDGLGLLIIAAMIISVFLICKLVCITPLWKSMAKLRSVKKRYIICLPWTALSILTFLILVKIWNPTYNPRQKGWEFLSK